ncbi:MAG TPA: BMP family ABC transporter substrate-binding protein [Ideonella sp.]|nr:BMP family ABC transporter substrate-binding protein [Ideonella sp.]
MSQNLAGAPSRVRRALVLSSPLALAAPGRAWSQAAVLNVGFVYVSPIGEAGWTFQHDLGRRAMERALGARVKTTVVESVPEGADAERVMRDLATQGCKLIFATSFGYLEPALKVAADFPDVRFEHCGGYKSAPNLGTYNARYYEGRYLAGLAAGQASARGVAGYVAGFPVPEVIQGINAFALGMRAVNARAEVHVLWLDTWFDPARERDAALALVGRGADVLTNHSASPAVAQAAEAKGVAFCGYQSDMRGFAPTTQLTSVVHDWGGYYARVVEEVLAGRWTNRPVWGGIADGFIRMAPFGPRVSAPTAALVGRREAEIVNGRLRPFAAPLFDRAGRERLHAGALDDAAILAMDWFVRGVVGSLPAR